MYTGNCSVQTSDSSVTLDSTDSDSDSFGEKVLDSSDSGFHTEDSQALSEEYDVDKKLSNNSSISPADQRLLPWTVNPMTGCVRQHRDNTNQPSHPPSSYPHIKADRQNASSMINHVTAKINLKRKSVSDKVSTSSDHNSRIKVTKPDSSEANSIRQRRFNRTAKALRESGLLPIAIKTGNLLKKNRILQQEIQNLKQEAAMFFQSIASDASQIQSTTE